MNTTLIKKLISFLKGYTLKCYPILKGHQLNRLMLPKVPLHFLTTMQSFIQMA